MKKDLKPLCKYLKSLGKPRIPIIKWNENDLKLDEYDIWRPTKKLLDTIRNKYELTDVQQYSVNNLISDKQCNKLVENDSPLKENDNEWNEDAFMCFGKDTNGMHMYKQRQLTKLINYYEPKWKGTLIKDELEECWTWDVQSDVAWQQDYQRMYFSLNGKEAIKSADQGIIVEELIKNVDLTNLQNFIIDNYDDDDLKNINDFAENIKLHDGTICANLYIKLVLGILNQNWWGKFWRKWKMAEAESGYMAGDWDWRIGDRYFYINYDGYKLKSIKYQYGVEFIFRPEPELTGEDFEIEYEIIFENESISKHMVVSVIKK